MRQVPASNRTIEIKKPLHEAFLFLARTYRLLRIATGCILLLLTWLLSDHHSPWSTFTQEACTAAALIFLYPWNTHKKLSKEFNYACLLFIGTIFIQTINRIVFFGDFIFAFTTIALMHMAATYGSKIATEKEKTTLNIFLSIILIAAIINSFIGLLQWQGLANGILILDSPTGRAYGNLAQPNQLATLIVTGISFLIILDAQNKIYPALIYILGAILIFTLCVTESRTGALSIFTLTGVIVALGNRTAAFKSLRWLAPGLLAFLMLHTNWEFISNHLGGKSNRVITYTDSSGRIDLWTQMLSAIQLKPWAGWGWLHLGAAQNAVTLSNPAALNIDHSHNLFIDLIVWLGIPIGGIIISLILLWTTKNLKISLQPQSNKITFPLLISLIPIAIHSLLEYPFSYLYFLLPTSFLVGTIEGCSQKTLSKKTINRNLINIFYSISIFFLIYIALEYQKIEDDFRAIRLERQFITSPEEKHTYNPTPKILTQYGFLIKSNRDESIPPSVITHQTMTRFPWLMNHQQHYLALLQENKCKEATEQLNIINALFGKFGVLKSQESITRTGIKHECNHENSENNPALLFREYPPPRLAP